MGISPISLLISVGQRAQENQCWCKDMKKVLDYGTQSPLFYHFDATFC